MIPPIRMEAVKLQTNFCVRCYHLKLAPGHVRTLKIVPEAHEDIHERALACPRATQDGGELAGSKLSTHIVQDHLLACKYQEMDNNWHYIDTYIFLTLKKFFLYKKKKKTEMVGISPFSKESIFNHVNFIHLIKFC